MSKHILDKNYWDNKWTLQIYDDELNTVEEKVISND